MDVRYEELQVMSNGLSAVLVLERSRLHYQPSPVILKIKTVLKKIYRYSDNEPSEGAHRTDYENVGV
jgi:hypothetical protein